jgi:hypothetical protein
MKPPINHLLQTYFSDLADLSHHISPIYSTSLLITSLIPLPISTSPEAEVERTALPLLMIIPSTTECHGGLGNFSLQILEEDRKVTLINRVFIVVLK